MFLKYLDLKQTVPMALTVFSKSGSESGASGGVKPEVETVSVVGMKVERKNHSEDLPN